MKNTIIGLGTDTVYKPMGSFRVASFRLQFLPSLNQVGRLAGKPCYYGLNQP